MKQKISDYEIEILEQYKNKLLLRYNGGDCDINIAIILDFKIEEIIFKNKNWWGKEKTIKQNYLTDYIVMSVNRTEKIKGYFHDESAYLYFRPYILRDYRKAFVNLREDLKILGFDLFDLEDTNKYIL